LAEAEYLSAAAQRDKLHDQYVAAERDLDASGKETASDALLQTYFDNRSAYEKAEAEAKLKNFRAQAAWDWWQQLSSPDDDE
jgi:hypothetical protein